MNPGKPAQHAHQDQAVQPIDLRGLMQGGWPDEGGVRWQLDEVCRGSRSRGPCLRWSASG